MRIRVSTNSPSEPLLRQTPDWRGLWKECQFTVDNPTADECDMWVVIEGLDRNERAFVRRGVTVFIALEPPESEHYEPAFLDQFDLVITSHTHLAHRNVRNEYQGLPWHAGIDRGARADQYERGRPRCTIDFDGFAAMRPPEKTGLISAVVSNKTHYPGHRARLEFLRILKQELGEQLHLFGRGIRPVTDKFEAIAPYRYHLALENGAVPHYWTEKLSDSFLGFAYPLYWGCPNITEYFPETSLEQIDITDPARGVAQVKAVLAADLVTERQAQLLAAREIVLDRHNIFDVMRRACLSMAPQLPRLVTLQPGSAFVPLAHKLNYARYRMTAKLPYRRQLKSALGWLGRGAS